MEKIIAQAAESIIIKQGNQIIKRRIKKGYRISEIDEKLRKLRTRSEAKIIERLKDKINVPKIIKADEKNKEITMQFIQGEKLSDYLDKLKLEQQEQICQEIGKEVAKMHDENIVHGDLTTSNMILVDNCCPNQENNCLNKNNCCPNDSKLVDNNKIHKGGCEHFGESKINLVSANQSVRRGEAGGVSFSIFLIDFGLSFHSIKIEDKAVDIHLFRQALESKHFSNWEKLYNSFLSGYNPQDKSSILKQLEKVEARGRYRKKAE